MASRVRPSRRPRWRRYVPGAVLALLGLVPFFAPTVLTDPLSSIGLGSAGARLALLAVPVLGAMLAAALADRSPVPALVVGTLAASLGGNAFAGPLVAVPLLIAGVAWLGFEEARRMFEGITVAPEGLSIHRPLREALTLDYGQIRAVHTSPSAGESGTLILETQHGTVTAPALPGCEELQARVEARTTRVPVHPTAESLADCRGRVQDLIRGGQPS